AGQRFMRKVIKKECGSQPKELWVRAQKFQRSHGIRLAEAEGRAAFARQRFRENEKSVGGIRQAKRCRCPEWIAQRVRRMNATDQPAKCGANNRAESKGGAQHAELGRAFLLRCDVGDISAG